MIIQKIKFLTVYFLNLNFSITITCTKFKFGFLILHTHSEGTVSQLFLLGLSFYFMLKVGKFFGKFLSIIFLNNELGPKYKI